MIDRQVKYDLTSLEQAYGQGIGVSTPIGGRRKYVQSRYVGLLGTGMKWSDAEPGAA